jgi:signal transduction histidine kinase
MPSDVGGDQSSPIDPSSRTFEKSRTESGDRSGESRLPRVLAYLWAQWDALGRLGRVALLGVIFSLVIALLLGVAIPASLERGLINAHLETLTTVGTEMVDRGLIGPDGRLTDLQALDAAVRDQLLGVDIVNVKVWDSSGTVVYSDDPSEIGATFPPAPDLTAALAGVAQAGHPGEDMADKTATANAGHVWEFYVPITDDSGRVVVVLEVYHKATELHAILNATRRSVWISIGTGLLMLLVFTLGLVAANFRIVNQKRREAERLFVDLAQAQQEERIRIIGALHDDVGQPLYRVLYGLEGSRSQLAAHPAISDELSRIADLVRGVDRALRSELTILNQGEIDELDLDTLLSNLTDDVRRESPLDVELNLGNHSVVPLGARAALFSAAREALTNTRKHSHASQVTIEIKQDGRRLELEIVDNGSGPTGQVGVGLATTGSRLEAIGGGLEVTSSESGGTRFRAWVPV